MSTTMLAPEVSHLEVAADQMSSDARRAMPCSSTATRRPARSSSSADAPPNLRAESSNADPSPAVTRLRLCQVYQACCQMNDWTALCNARFFIPVNTCALPPSAQMRQVQPIWVFCQGSVSECEFFNATWA